MPTRRQGATGRFRRLVPHRSKEPGSAPGTLVYGGRHDEAPIRLSLIEFSADGFEEHREATIEECLASLDYEGVTWINVAGLHDMDLIRSLGALGQVHRLVLEDIVHVHQRPKVEEYDDSIFTVVRMLTWDPEGRNVQDEQVSLVVSHRLVISFQERIGDVFEPVRERLRAGKGTIRQRGADYLAYALIDAVVDHYFQVMEAVSDKIESMEERTLGNPDPDVVAEIHRLRREMTLVRRSIWPLRDALSILYRGDGELIEAETRLFFRDVYDHSVQVIDTVESLREVLSGLLDLYLTSVSNRMNEVMKVLTIIATIFIPLTFLAGIYGMNFDVMPELHMTWAYPALLGVMAVIGLIMVAFFKRRGWF